MQRVLVLMVLWAGAAQAEVFKCTDADGRKQYQDQPCADGARGARLDLSTGNVTLIDSQAARREAQGALLAREETRERVVEVTTPAGQDTRVTLSGPAFDTRPYDDYDEGPDGYPVYLLRPDRHRDHDRRRPPRRPDETPMIEPPRAIGGGYVPEPPTIRQIAPRPPDPSRPNER